MGVAQPMHEELSPSLALASIIKPHSITEPKRRLIKFLPTVKVDEAETDFVGN